MIRSSLGAFFVEEVKIAFSTSDSVRFGHSHLVVLRVVGIPLVVLVVVGVLVVVLVVGILVVVLIVVGCGKSVVRNAVHFSSNVVALRLLSFA